MKSTISFCNSFRPVNCGKCPAKGRTQVIADSEPAEFIERIDVLFVGVNPGRKEAQLGTPFCGPAGKLLREYARKILIGKTLGFTNVMLCSTGNEAEIPDPGSCFEFCRKNVQAICRFFNPVLYVPCGTSAMQRFGIQGRITENQGRLFQIGSAKVLPMVHPSAILRGFANRELLERTMRAILSVL